VLRYGPLALLLLSGAVVATLVGTRPCSHDCLRDYYLLVLGVVWACAAAPVSAWSFGQVRAVRSLAWILSMGWVLLGWWAALVLVPWVWATA
jgi:hypothetical protein